MEKPALVVMAAGLGSRYGGLKQLAPMGPNGWLIIDYSACDACRAGFETIVFIIKEELQQDFDRLIGSRLKDRLNVKYVYQKVTDLPPGYSSPKGREKPWGTCHATLAAAGAVNGPFAVINADDYYGPKAFSLIYDFLSAKGGQGKPYPFAMVGYRLKNTVTEHGHVARGVCQVDETGLLTGIREILHIEKQGDGIRYLNDDGTYTPIDPESVVSMNMWGFTHDFFNEATAIFPDFLDKALTENPMKAEFYLPYAVDILVSRGDATVTVLNTPDKWYGVTYKEDKESVTEALKKLHDNGTYPQK